MLPLLRYGVVHLLRHALAVGLGKGLVLERLPAHILLMAFSLAARAAPTGHTEAYHELGVGGELRLQVLVGGVRGDGQTPSHLDGVRSRLQRQGLLPKKESCS
jgi:hypothetical protein